MNEPSVFDGPEITMPPTLLHHDAEGRAYEHRELHNMYGLLMSMGTMDGQKKAYPERRPFVLTRAFFSGSQRYAAVWTGDNKASWAHLAASTPMLLSLSVAGIPFVGADVGGFFGNPDPALLVRWYQVAAFHPFLRAHAEFKTKRREPWLFGEAITRQVSVALRLRYSLLPYLYTLFAQHAADGALVMRPMWHVFPKDAELGRTAWWSEAIAEAKVARAAAAAAAKVEAAEKKAKAEVEAAAKAEIDRVAAAAKAAAAAVEAEAAEGTESVAEADATEAEGACPCHKCDESRCFHPDCQVCGIKETSGCDKPDATGCYTAAAAECTCDADPAAAAAKRKLKDEDEDEDDEDRDRDRGDDDDEDDDKPETDYNQEYYHGEAKDGEQDEGQLQTAEQFMLGGDVLVQPITAKTCEQTQVYLPGPAAQPTEAAVWYDLHTYQLLASAAGARVVTVPVHADRVPAFVRGGAVLPRRERPRRASAATHADPFTLLVAPDTAGGAAGALYLDGYDGYEHEAGARLLLGFEFAAGTLRVTPDVSPPPPGVPAAASGVERIVFLGQSAPRRAFARVGAAAEAFGESAPFGVEVETRFDAAAGTIVVRKPPVSVGVSFTITLLE